MFRKKKIQVKTNVAEIRKLIKKFEGTTLYKFVYGLVLVFPHLGVAANTDLVSLQHDNFTKFRLSRFRYVHLFI